MSLKDKKRMHRYADELEGSFYELKSSWDAFNSKIQEIDSGNEEFDTIISKQDLTFDLIRMKAELARVSSLLEFMLNGK